MTLIRCGLDTDIQITHRSELVRNANKSSQWGIQNVAYSTVKWQEIPPKIVVGHNSANLIDMQNLDMQN